MTAKARPRWWIALLSWCLDDNEPLAGDLIEESAHRSRTWFWCQLTFAALARMATGVAGALRDPAQLLAPLAFFAMLTVLCFQVVVAGSLLAGMIPLTRMARPEWPAFVVLMSFLVAALTGKAASRLRARSRVAPVVLCGAAAAVTAMVTRSAASSTAPVFFPALGFQMMAAIVFVIGLFAGAADWVWWRHDPASAQTGSRSQRSRWI